MCKQFAKILSVLALAVGLLISQVGSIQAQGLLPTATPTTTPAVVASEAPLAELDPNVITFTTLRRSEIQLVGPYDSTAFSFSIPANWKLSTGATLEISMDVSFNTVVENQTEVVFRSGGLLSVLIDNQVIKVIPLNQIGEITENISIPSERLISQNADQSLNISFILNSGMACRLDQHTNVFIHPTSRFILPHESIKPDVSLVNFPRPIYQNSVITDSALLVTSDSPTAAEMKAALTVSAGLSNLSGNSMLLDLTTVSKLTPDQEKENHLILVGQAATLPILKQLTLPVPLNNNQFEVVGGKPEDGVIQMINSPWSEAHVILVVSGNTEQGVIKAAQAVSTGVIQPNLALNVAVIEKVDLTAASISEAEDRTLAEMGYDNALFQRRGVSQANYTFNIPPGFTLASGAYLDLIYGNSALLNFNRSAIVVQLNNRPIGSVRLSEISAGSATNKARILIPTSAIVQGRNVLQVVATMWPTDDCTPPGLNQGLWINIWPESRLHLPLVPAAVTLVSTQKDLATYFPAFINNPALSETAFVLSGNNPETWRSAVQFAAYLGAAANGPITDLSVFYGDALPAAERSKYNFLIFGRPSELPILREMGSDLPAPFLENSDIPLTSNFRVTYRIPPEAPMGYIEIMPSAWNPQKTVLAILGNTAEGVSWATTALIDPTLSSRLAGNFALVDNRQILTTDTRAVAAVAQAVATLAPGEAAPPIVITPAPMQVPTSQTDWILPVLVVTIVLIVLVLGIVFLGNRARNRMRRKKS